MVRLSDRAIQREISYRGSGGYCTSKPAMSVAVQRTIGIGACRTHCMAPVARSLAPGQSRLSSTACHKGQVGPWRGGKCGCAVCRNRSNCRPDHACPANSPGPSLVRCHTRRGCRPYRPGPECGHGEGGGIVSARAIGHHGVLPEEGHQEVGNGDVYLFAMAKSAVRPKRIDASGLTGTCLQVQDEAWDAPVEAMEQETAMCPQTRTARSGCVSGAAVGMGPARVPSAFEGLGAAHDLQDLAGDGGLSGLVVGKAQVLQQTVGIVGGLVHGGHAGTVF